MVFLRKIEIFFSLKTKSKNRLFFEIFSFQFLHNLKPVDTLSI